MKKEQGFSLIELMIAVAILGILVSVAYPSYVDYVRDGRRTDGQAMLMEAASRMERAFYTNRTYSTDLTDAGFSASSGVDSAEGSYKISVVAATVACPVASCFVLEATPQGNQAADGKLRLDSVGNRLHDANNDGDFADSGETSWN
ncbi:type IV pilin protein [Marinobacterium jannaschii]|uniref:type IV pilin protein n=1 Tax=Marinobacterium jannaschii TaxID=64970 RepID=UPI0004838B0C|nr:type IV pilin protein [Marinobacterium jannaschii]